jgi:hypothetical protein
MRMQWELRLAVDPDLDVPPEVVEELTLRSRLFEAELELPDDQAAKLDACLDDVDAREAALIASIE